MKNTFEIQKILESDWNWLSRTSGKNFVVRSTSKAIWGFDDEGSQSKELFVPGYGHDNSWANSRETYLKTDIGFTEKEVWGKYKDKTLNSSSIEERF